MKLFANIFAKKNYLRYLTGFGIHLCTAIIAPLIVEFEQLFTHRIFTIYMQNDDIKEDFFFIVFVISLAI